MAYSGDQEAWKGCSFGWIQSGSKASISQHEWSSQKVHNVATPLVAGPKMPVKTSAKTTMNVPQPPPDAWAEYRARNPGLASSQSQPARSVDPPTATKFQAIETRLAQYEQGMQSLQQQMEAQAQFNVAADSRMAAVEAKMNEMPRTVEGAIARAMSSQEKRLDKKFDALMSALGKTAKRTPAGPGIDSDEDMESPLKELPTKK